ncbi:9244_t:CDS:2 [Ambispora gerdemannii]|uniref:9244_t:CDS:1 n=1 Tax=Ambispora gerdemannii TaxID=144530 RepID=A0A9N8V5H7_9GLOM|nr:9244_t:CDS:2 [Ambispora gerdemannii]
MSNSNAPSKGQTIDNHTDNDNDNFTETLDASEITPLLQVPTQLFSGADTSNDAFSNSRLEDTSISDTDGDALYDLKETFYLIKKAIPVLLTYLMQYSLQIASVFSLGHLGSVELASAALASMYAAVTGWSVALGASSALDTLCSQAWTSGNPRMVGIFLQRAIVIILLGFCPIAITWWEAESILVLLKQDEKLAHKAGLFLRYLLIGAPAYLVFECLKKYLQAQGKYLVYSIMKASTYVLIVCSITNAFLNYALVWYEPISLGFIGAPVATSITYWLMLILLSLYTVYVDGSQAWGGWTRACLRDWGSFLRLALPGILMVCAEWWAFELVALAAGYLGSVALATQSIVLTTASLVYQMPFGIAVSTSNRVGNFLGAGLAGRAKMSAKMSLVLSVIFACLNSCVLLAFKNQWGYLFTKDPEVIDMVANILPLCAYFQVSDGISAIGGGILRGQGRQKLGAIFNLTGYYLVALPLGLSLTFKYSYGLKGLWIGLTCASYLVSFAVFWAIINTDWKWEVEECRRRIKIVDAEVKANGARKNYGTDLEEGFPGNHTNIAAGVGNSSS